MKEKVEMLIEEEVFALAKSLTAEVRAMVGPNQSVNRGRTLTLDN
jgi:hypothetical protein